MTAKPKATVTISAEVAQFLLNTLLNLSVAAGDPDIAAKADLIVRARTELAGGSD